MKYCKNCGMLLEDTHEHCIRCGVDVTVPENVSMYPIEVMETIEEEKERKKHGGGTPDEPAPRRMIRSDLHSASSGL